MYITVLNASETQVAGKNGKAGYQKLEVAYKDEEGKVTSKNLISIYAKDIYPTLKAAQPGDVFDVTSVKEGDYWVWKSLVKSNSPAPVASASAPSGETKTYTAPKSNYETPEERAQKQIYIARTSGISNAIASLSVGAKAPLEPVKVLEVAQKFFNFIMLGDDGTPLAMKDDSDQII
jgi:hypothetical protein